MNKIETPTLLDKIILFCLQNKLVVGLLILFLTAWAPEADIKQSFGRIATA